AIPIIHNRCAEVGRIGVLFIEKIRKREILVKFHKESSIECNRCERQFLFKGTNLFVNSNLVVYRKYVRNLECGRYKMQGKFRCVKFTTSSLEISFFRSTSFKHSLQYCLEKRN